jgi:RNA polymerase sigma-70 factor (ECF subfamily)
MNKNDFKDNEQVFKLLNDPATCKSTFSNIVRTYQQRLYWHIRKMVAVHDDANDILQNTFIKAWKNILKYRGDANILTWLYRIATNETIDYLNSSYTKIRPLFLEALLLNFYYL